MYMHMFIESGSGRLEAAAAVKLKAIINDFTDISQDINITEKGGRGGGHWRSGFSKKQGCRGIGWDAG